MLKYQFMQLIPKFLKMIQSITPITKTSQFDSVFIYKRKNT
jgi:hypothetical protein